MFHYDWFHGSSLTEQRDEAKRRCVLSHFPGIDSKSMLENQEVVRFLGDLQLRTLIYLRDGFSYEVKEVADVSSRSHLVFECEPVDDHYKVGAFVVTVPFEEIARVEVYAVHASEKPDDLPQITGFRNQQEPGEVRAKPGKARS